LYSARPSGAEFSTRSIACGNSRGSGLPIAGGGGVMVAISLIVELIRTRPLTLFWGMAATQVVLWTLVPALFFSAPPGQLPVTLAIGHEFQLGTEFGPPLAFWLAEIAFRIAGLFGVYLLSQLCVVVTYWAVLSLGRAIVGEVHAVMAVLLMAGVAAFSFPTPEFGPAVLATPLWALALMHYWRAAETDRAIAWVVLGCEIGLLLLTTYAGLVLVALLVIFMASTEFGRARLAGVGPWIAGIVVMAMLFPFLIWLDLSGESLLPDLATVARNLWAWGEVTVLLVAGHIGLGILVVLARGTLGRAGTPPVEIVRPSVSAAARSYVYFFALVPAAAMVVFALFTRRPETFVGIPLAVLSGLAVIVAAGDRARIEHQYAIGPVWAVLLLLPPVLVALFVVIQPWVLAIDLQIGRPAATMAHFFADSFQRRTGRPLTIVAGDPPTASLVSLMAPSRPSLYLESSPKYLPRVSREDVEEKGALVLWTAEDTAGRPPPEILRQFPGLVPEVPRSFERLFQGRMPLTRIGWAMIRPRAQLIAPTPPEARPQPQPQAQPLPMPAPQPRQPVPQAQPSPQQQPQSPLQQAQPPQQQTQPQPQPQPQPQQPPRRPPRPIPPPFDHRPQ
jgi:hypothetical protein